MPLDKTVLLDLLRTVDAQLSRPIIVVAIGGTALTLLDAKISTVDVDLAFPDRDLDEFQRALRALPKPGFRMDCFGDGDIFGLTLPNDYLQRCIPIEKFRLLELRTLSPVDIVVTKISRLDDRDKQDIMACVRRFKLTKEQIAERAGQVELAGSEEQYHANLKIVLNSL